MANYRGLTLQSGVVTQIQNSDQLIVGAGITTEAGNLTISSAGGTTTLSDDVIISGNLSVMGTTFTTDTETVLISDNSLYLNNGYTTVAPLTGGLTVNYLPTALTDTVNGAYVAGVPGVSNPTVGTSGGGTFAAGDLIQISSSDDNNGLFEVLSQALNVLTIRGVGLTPCVEDFTQNQFVAGPSDGATITKVNVSIIRSDLDGDWEVGKGNVTPIVFSPIIMGAIYSAIGYQFFEGGAELTPGTKVYLIVPGDCVIESWTLLADAVGDLELDIQSTTFVNFPAGFTSIVGGSPPELNPAQKGFDDVLTGWTTSLPKGTILALEIVSVSGIANATLQLSVRRA